MRYKKYNFWYKVTVYPLKHFLCKFLFIKSDYFSCCFILFQVSRYTDGWGNCCFFVLKIFLRRFHEKKLRFGSWYILSCLQVVIQFFVKFISCRGGFLLSSSATPPSAPTSTPFRASSTCRLRNSASRSKMWKKLREISFSQCGNYIIFKSLRISVKSITGIFEVQKLQL